MTGEELFQEVVRITGVSPVLAPGMIKRSLADGGVTVETAKPEDYEAALPKIRARLKAYVTPEEADEKTKAIASRMAELKGMPRLTPSQALRRDRLGDSGMKDLKERSGATDMTKIAPDLAPSYDLADTDTTLHGRRWTADEKAQLDAAKRERNKP